MNEERLPRVVDRITLDRESFKALASDTRLDILRALDERQKTVTELAKELDLNKATVFEHLETLVKVDLVQKLENERKWVYYQLSWKGRRILHPEKITIALMLSSSLASLLTGGIAFWSWKVGREVEPEGAGGDNTMSIRAVESAPAGPEIVHDPWLLAAAIALGVVALALVAGSWLLARRARASRAAQAA